MLRRLIRKVRHSLTKARILPAKPVEFIHEEHQPRAPQQVPSAATGVKSRRHGHAAGERRRDRHEGSHGGDRPHGEKPHGRDRPHGERGRERPPEERGRGDRTEGEGRRRRDRGERPPREPRHSSPPVALKPRNVPPPDDWSVSSFPVDPAEGMTRFHDFNLPPRIMHGIADLGFKYCTPVQAQVLPIALSGQDVAAKSQTGTGKTAAFLVATFNRFLVNPPAREQKPGCPRALVLAPTRELAVQIGADAENIGRYCGFRSMVIFGGMDYRKQRGELESEYVDLAVATPGRLLDFEKQKAIGLDSVEMLVIDEADRMLDMGFIPDVSRIVSRLPPKEKRQTMLFSATLSPTVLRLASRWMREPASIEIEPEKMTVDSVDQQILAVNSRDKFTILYNILRQAGTDRTIVFGNRRDTTRGLCDDLRRCGISCDLLSGDMPQEKRLKILDAFKDGSLPVVVATDVAARGIHVEDISHVVNYDVPYEAEDYVHRIGRTARVGKTGKAITFACEREAFTIPEIEKFIGRSIPCLQPDESLLAPPPVAPLGARVRERRGDHGGGNRFRGGSRPGGGSRHHGRPGRGSRRPPGR